MDPEYRELLLAAERHYQESWEVYLTKLGYTSVRICCVLLAKLAFVVRDATIVVMNLLYLLVLAPVDLFLVFIYLAAVNVQPDPDEDDLWYPELPPDKRDGKMADLNIIRRMFWAGKQVAISNNFRSLSIPKTVITEETVLDGNKPGVIQNWRDANAKSTIEVVHKTQPAVNPTLPGPTDAKLDSFNDQLREYDEIRLDNSQVAKLSSMKQANQAKPKKEKKQRLKIFGSSEGKRRNLLYFLTRPNDFKTLEKYTKKIIHSKKIANSSNMPIYPA